MRMFTSVHLIIEIFHSKLLVVQEDGSVIIGNLVPIRREDVKIFHRIS